MELCSLNKFLKLRKLIFKLISEEPHSKMPNFTEGVNIFILQPDTNDKVLVS